MKDFKHIIGQIANRNTIAFTEDELTSQRTGQVKPLHITFECHGMIIFRMLSNNRAVLNVYAAMTFRRIGIEESMIRPNGMMVRGVWWHQNCSLRRNRPQSVNWTLWVRGFLVVVNIPIAFNLRLGRSWITTLKPFPTIPSESEFILGIRLISVMDKEDLIVPTSTMVPFIDAQQVDHASRYHSFKFVSFNYTLR